MNAVVTRRQLVAVAALGGLGLLAGCERLPWQAQQPTKTPRIGWLSSFGDPRSVSNGNTPAASFFAGLRDLGYVEGQNIIVEYRYGATAEDRLQEFAAELVQAKVGLIVAGDSLAIQPALRATSTIPIVMTVSGNPVAEGLVASLAKPGGNLTGLSNLAPELAGKRLELLRAAAPWARRIAVLWNSAHPGVPPQFGESERAARILGIELQSLEVRSPADVERVLEHGAGEGVGALVVLPDPLVYRYIPQTVGWAVSSRLPAMYPFRPYVDAGGLMVYAPNLLDLFRRAAYYVDRILKGAKPADLPIEQPMLFDFVVNMKAARELGVSFPPEILLQMTEVIE
jgi:putative tryptophan/tyrosine transport system substrate-binding protein